MDIMADEALMVNFSSGSFKPYKTHRGSFKARDKWAQVSGICLCYFLCSNATLMFVLSIIVLLKSARLLGPCVYF